jgi:hypothetical protein
VGTTTQTKTDQKTCLAWSRVNRPVRFHASPRRGRAESVLAVKHAAAGARTSIIVMDTLALDAVAAVACIAVGIALRYGKPRIRRSAPPTILPLARSIREVRRRHRRAARAIVELAHECLERHPGGSFEAFTAREALRSYLPQTLAAYLAVPRALRRVRRPGRPSADDELSRQLRTLHRGLERIREADAEIGASQMTANGAFLGERFAAPDSSRPSDRRPLLSEFVDVVESALRRT